MTPPELTCQELVELVTDYLEEALPADERAVFEKHLAECDGCFAHLEQMRTTIRCAGELKPENVPPEAEEALRHAFRAWRERTVGK